MRKTLLSICVIALLAAVTPLEGFANAGTGGRRYGAMRLSPKDDVVELTVQREGECVATARVPAELLAVELFDVAFNAAYILDYAKRLDDAETVTFAVHDASSPARLFRDGREGEIYVLMPTRC